MAKLDRQPVPGAPPKAPDEVPNRTAQLRKDVHEMRQGAEQYRSEERKLEAQAEEARREAIALQDRSHQETLKGHDAQDRAENAEGMAGQYDKQVASLQKDEADLEARAAKDPKRADDLREEAEGLRRRVSDYEERARGFREQATQARTEMQRHYDTAKQLTQAGNEVNDRHLKLLDQAEEAEEKAEVMEHNVVETEKLIQDLETEEATQEEIQQILDETTGPAAMAPADPIEQEALANAVLGEVTDEDAALVASIDAPDGIPAGIVVDGGDPAMAEHPIEEEVAVGDPIVAEEDLEPVDAIAAIGEVEGSDGVEAGEPLVAEGPASEPSDDFGDVPA